MATDLSLSPASGPPPPPAAPRPRGVRALAYDRIQATPATVVDARALRSHRREGQVLWVDVDDLGDGPLLQEIAEVFGLHPLAMEDVVSQRQRPKVESYDDYVFVVFRIVGSRATGTQLSLFLGRDFVLTFTGQHGDIFDQVVANLQRPESKVRHRGADFLAYNLVDALIDRYFPLVDALSDQVDELQEETVLRPGGNLVARINHTKRQLLRLRRAVWPLREELRALMHNERMIEPETVNYLRDCHDHAVLLADNIDTLREMSAGLMDTYLSVVNQRMNEIMKTLTIIATIFIPLTFIAGIYGMNFSPEASPWNMPELTWRWGYPAALALMAAVASAFTGYMWSKGWFRPLSEAPPVAGSQPRRKHPGPRP